MLVTLATYSDHPRAELARGRLEGEGIATTLSDQHIVGISWLYSVAFRGVKLQVGVADAARALAGSTRLTVYVPLRFLAALTLMPFWPLALAVGISLIHWKASWRCLSCNRRW